jgi:hypothetical protein
MVVSDSSVGGAAVPQQMQNESYPRYLLRELGVIAGHNSRRPMLES